MSSVNVPNALTRLAGNKGSSFVAKTTIVTQTKAELQGYDPDSARNYSVLSRDGGTFKGVTGAAPGTYVDDGGAACGLTIVPIGGDGSAAFIRINYTEANAFWFLTDSQIVSVESYTYIADMTLPIQNAWDVTHAKNVDIFHPAGGYKVTKLIVPGTAQAPDERRKSQRIYGQGVGEQFALAGDTGSTIFDSTTDSPVLEDLLDLVTGSNGQKNIEYIRFHGTSTTPVVKLQSMFGLSGMKRCVIYQRGVGDGVNIGRGALLKFDHCFSFNSDFSTTVLGAARNGIAWNLATPYDVGLVTFDTCSGRGFKEAFVIAGVGGGRSLCTKLINCQASVTYNGLRIEDGNSTVVDNFYCEGGDQGTGIIDRGDYSIITGGIIGAGYMIGVDVSDTTAKGTIVDGVTVSVGGKVNATCIHVGSSAAFGGYNKTVTNNSLVYTLGTAGVTGLKITGTDPRLNTLNNSFDPKGAWTGAGTLKIDDQSTGGVYGMMQGMSGNYEFPVLSKGGIILFDTAPALTESDIAGTDLALPPDVSYFEASATVAKTVNSFDAGKNSGRLIMIRTINANITIANTARIKLDGGVSFTGPGMITFVMKRSGGLTYAYEQGLRTVY